MGVTNEAVTMGVTNVVIVCALALALSLVVERLIELLKSVLDLVDSRVDLCQYWTRRAIVIRDFIQNRLRALEYVRPDEINGVLQKANDVLRSEERRVGK